MTERAARIASGAPLALVALGVLTIGFAAGRATGPQADRAVEAPRDQENAVSTATGSSVATASSNPSSPPEPSAGSAPTGGLMERLKSLETISASKRSIDEDVELALGHQELARRQTWALEANLGARTIDPTALVRLRELARDDAVAPAVLSATARHPTREAADLLHDVATDREASESIRYLANDLLSLPAVRKAASTELGLVLDLDAARSCEVEQTLVGRAQTLGDDRALPALVALENEKGCGRDRKSDCHPCLRGNTALFEAREAVKQRPYTPPWRSTVP